MSTDKKTTPHEAPGQKVAAAKHAEHNPETKTPGGDTAPGTPEPSTVPTPASDPTKDKPKNPADNESDVPLEALVVAIDAADAAFAHIGGSSRDWVEKAFLPALKDNHIVLKTFL